MKNKKVVGIICAVAIIAIIIVICIAINKMNNDNKNAIAINNVSNENNIAENKSLNELSFNGIKISDKIEEKMKNIVLDGPYSYQYENICIDTDINDNIDYLGFFTSSDAQGNKIKSIEDINIEYNNNKLETIADFKENLGNGTESNESSNKYYIRYYDNNLELSLFIINDEIYNVILEKIN